MLNRRHFRSLRQNLSPAIQLEHAESLALRIVQTRFFLNAQQIAFYLPMDGEIDPQPLMEIALTRKKHCYLPCIISGKNSANRLAFQRYDPPDTPLQLNRFGIPEPQYNPKLGIKNCMLDLVFIPMVAFDTMGNRLGMGKGYYDQTFSRERLRWRRPLMVGLAHSTQGTDNLPANSWDVPMDIVVTEEECIGFKRHRGATKWQ